MRVRKITEIYICRFLEANSLNLSPADQKKADALIERSQKQLQIIEKVTGNESKGCDTPAKQLQETAEISNNQATERYVDMSKKPVLPKRTIIVESQVCETKCPFQDLPAKEASQEIKYGTLSKRRKVFNIIDVSTKVYAAIHENWLLIYGSTKDLKPDCALDLKCYEAKEDETDPNFNQPETTKEEVLKKNSLTFKMTSSFKVFHSTFPERKNYNFVATTHKDMLQWVVNINRRHDKAVLTTKTIQEEQNYEICQDLQGSDEENIYNEIEMPCQSVKSHPVSLNVSEKDDRPAIPEKRPTAPKNVPLGTSTSSPTESMVSYEELERKAPLKNASLNSFESSDDDEDQTYYELDTITRGIKVNVKEDLEENKINFDVPPPPFIPIEIDLSIAGDEDLTYENSFSVEPRQLSNKESSLKNAINESPTSEKKLPEPPVLRNDETKTKSCVPKKNFAKPLTPKPKILSPKPWKTFGKNASSKSLRSPQISKNKPIRESLKSPLKLESKPSFEITPYKDISVAKENSASTNNSPKTSNNDISTIKASSASTDNDASTTSSDTWSSKPHHGGSIVRIIRNRWSTSQSSSRSLETFSTSKIETFQASPTKEAPPTDFLGSPSTNSTSSLRPIDSLIPDLTKNCKNIDEKPMVLLKASPEDEESSKKLKKSPVVPVKPKKVAKKLAY